MGGLLIWPQEMAGKHGVIPAINAVRSREILRTEMLLRWFMAAVLLMRFILSKEKSDIFFTFLLLDFGA